MNPSNILFIDCQNGISGDMSVAAFLDAGMPFEFLEKHIDMLNFTDISIRFRKVKRGAFAAKKFDVIEEKSSHAHHGLHIPEIYKKLSLLPKPICEKASLMFDKLIAAEKYVHGGGDHVHLHEVGQPDSIIDIVGIACGLTYFGVHSVYASPVALNKGGEVKCAHGMIPLPAPATLCLLKKNKVVVKDSSFELTTPTGACFISAFSEKKNSASIHFEMDSIGIGAGSYNPKHAPNILRFMMGSDTHHKKALKSIIKLECNIDDMNPEFYDLLFERLFEMKALDVFLLPTIMKKQRPGVVLNVLCEEANLQSIQKTIFENSTTFGMRFVDMGRFELDRKKGSIQTKYGPIKAKIGLQGESVVMVVPEYESCKTVAKKKGISVLSVYNEALLKKSTIK